MFIELLKLRLNRDRLQSKIANISVCNIVFVYLKEFCKILRSYYLPKLLCLRHSKTKWGYSGSPSPKKNLLEKFLFQFFFTIDFLDFYNWKLDKKNMKRNQGNVFLQGNAPTHKTPHNS